MEKIVNKLYGHWTLKALLIIALVFMHLHVFYLSSAQHLDDDRLHLTLDQEQILSRLINQGFPFNKQAALQLQQIATHVAVMDREVKLIYTQVDEIRRLLQVGRGSSTY